MIIRFPDVYRKFSYSAQYLRRQTPVLAISASNSVKPTLFQIRHDKCDCVDETRNGLHWLKEIVE